MIRFIVTEMNAIRLNVVNVIKIIIIIQSLHFVCDVSEHVSAQAKLTIFFGIVIILAKMCSK